MPTAATRQDIEDLLGGADLSASADRVDRRIVSAEGAVLAELPGFRFGETDDATVTLDPDGDDLLVLPYYPVRSVSAVTIDGIALDAGDWTVDTLGNLRRGNATADIHNLAVNDVAGGLNGRWPDRGTVVVVTYSYGYASAATPQVIRDVVAEVAAARIVNPTQVAQESLGDRSVSYGTGGANADGLSTSQRRRIRNWRRTRMASARVRS